MRPTVTRIYHLVSEQSQTTLSEQKSNLRSLPLFALAKIGGKSAIVPVTLILIASDWVYLNQMGHRSAKHIPSVDHRGERWRSYTSFFSTIALLVLVKSMPPGAEAQHTNSSLYVDQLLHCSNTSLGLSLLGPDAVKPCIIYEVKPT